MKPILSICCSLCFFISFAQNKNQFYALDSNMNPTVLDSSKYILWIYEKEDSNWQWDYYRSWGPLVKSTQYADHDGKILNGRFCRYNSFGNLDSTGVFDHGKRNGNFIKLASFGPDSIRSIRKYVFRDDSLLRFVDLSNDSVRKKEMDTTGFKDSELIGGFSQWQKYLQENMVYPARARDREIQGTVRIHFRINKTGEIGEAYLNKSVEYSIDQEALRLIKKTPQWVPGTIDGKPVDTYKILPIRFGLEKK